MPLPTQPQPFSPPPEAYPPPRILVADGQPAVLDEIALLLRPLGYRIDLAPARELARKALLNVQYEAALIDVRFVLDLPAEEEGLTLLDEVVALDNEVGIILLTPAETLEHARQALKRGARDFIEKPLKDARLLFSVVRTQIELCRASREAERRSAEHQMLSSCDWPLLIANSPAMAPLLENVPWIALSEDNVIITGETGVGKREIAKILHLLSPRRTGPFICLEAGSVSEQIPRRETRSAEDDRYPKNLQIYELANGGTLLLPSVDQLSPGQQANLLRLLKPGNLHGKGTGVRVICSTRLGLRLDAEEFDRDLLACLQGAGIHVPALRERKEDIPRLASYFLRLANECFRRNVLTFSPAAMEVLMQQDWPGNVRELKHAVERAVAACRTEQVGLGDLGLNGPRFSSPPLEALSLSGLQNALIRKTLDRFGGDISRAADALGLSRRVLCRRIRRYKL